MALPHRRQRIARFIKSCDLSYRLVALAVGIKLSRFSNIVKGNVYPSPKEIADLSAFFSMPPSVLFEPEMLRYNNESWPPKPGPMAASGVGELDG